MTNNKTDGTEAPALDMISVQTGGMALAVARTISALIGRGDLDQTDWATARLALEVAERIDQDGPKAGISLYSRLHSLVLDLPGSRIPQQQVCPMAAQATEPSE